MSSKKRARVGEGPADGLEAGNHVANGDSSSISSSSDGGGSKSDKQDGEQASRSLGSGGGGGGVGGSKAGAAPPGGEGSVHGRTFEPAPLHSKAKFPAPATYAGAAPYPHGRVKPFLDEALYAALRAEVKQLHHTRKETDLFKLAQVGW
jgi:hypothetical protein